jgi:hypothetical protein
MQRKNVPHALRLFSDLRNKLTAEELLDQDRAKKDKRPGTPPKSVSFALTPAQTANQAIDPTVDPMFHPRPAKTKFQINQDIYHENAPVGQSVSPTVRQR